VDVNVSFPEDYGKEELAGKPALFKVKVKDIKVKELPVLDDEFAKDVSEFDTLEAYKEDLRKKLLHSAEHKAEHETEDAVVDKVVDNAAVEIPEVMIENRIDSLARDFDMRLRYQGLDLQKYLEIMGMDADSFRGQFRDRAEKEVKTQLVLEKIAQVETVVVSDVDVEEEIAVMAEKYKQSVEEFKKHLRDEDIEYIKGDLVYKKTIEYLVKNAKIA
jgi:trigger factor